MRQAIGVLSAVVLWSPLAGAQSLETFLAAAREHGASRMEALANLRQRQDESTSNWVSLAPTLSVSAGDTFNQYETKLDIPGFAGSDGVNAVIVPRNQLDATLRVDLPLVDVARWARIATGGANAEVAEARLRDATQQLQQVVIVAYHDALAGVQLEAAADRSVAAAEAFLKQTEQRVSAGRATELDLERARAELARQRQSRAEARRTRLVAQRRLETASGLPVQQLEAPPDDPLTDELPLANWESNAATVPAVEGAARERHLAELNALASKAVLLPRLQAFGAERFTNATGFLGKVATWSIGLTLNWSLDVSAIHSIRALDAAADSVSARERQVREQAQDQIFADWQQVVALIEQVRAARASQAAAAHALELARQRYEAGTITQVELIQAQRDSFEAQATRVRSDLQLVAARLLLRLDAGQPLTPQTSEGRS